MRGSIGFLQNWTAQSQIAGLFRQPQSSYIFRTRKVSSGTATIDPWNAPLAAPSSAANLASASTTLDSVFTDGLNLAATTGSYTTVDGALGFRSTVLDRYVYALSYDSTAAAVLDDSGAYYMKPINLLYATAPYNYNSFVIATGAPHGGLDVRSYQNRIWQLGGIDTPGSGTTFSPNMLFFTNPIAGGGGGPSADWKDPVSGLTNKIKISGTDSGVGLAVIRNGLLVFKSSSLFLLRGTTTANYTVTQISSEIGCIDARSIVETDAGVFFMSARGWMSTDGVRIKDMNGPMRSLFRVAAGSVQWANVRYSGGWCQAKLSRSGDIYISFGSQGIGVAFQSPILSVIYSPSTNSWTRLTSTLWNTGNSHSAGMLVSDPTDYTKLAGANDTLGYVLEDSQHLGTIVGDPLFSAYSYYDLYWNSGASAVYGSPIPAAMRTRFAPIVGTTTLTRKFAQLKRFFSDTSFPAIAGGGNWTVTPVDANSAQIGSATISTTPVSGGATWLSNVFVSGNPPTNYTPAITRNDCQITANEISDIAFTIAPNLPPDTGASHSNQGEASIYGIGLEYQTTRDLK